MKVRAARRKWRDTMCKATNETVLALVILQLWKINEFIKQSTQHVKLIDSDPSWTTILKERIKRIKKDANQRARKTRREEKRGISSRVHVPRQELNLADSMIVSRYNNRRIIKPSVNPEHMRKYGRTQVGTEVKMIFLEKYLIVIMIKQDESVRVKSQRNK